MFLKHLFYLSQINYKAMHIHDVALTWVLDTLHGNMANPFFTSVKVGLNANTFFDWFQLFSYPNFITLLRLYETCSMKDFCEGNGQQYISLENGQAGEILFGAGCHLWSRWGESNHRLCQQYLLWKSLQITTSFSMLNFQ